MKALSLTQPWAWIVVHGGKRIENRVWNTSYRGRFLIHASKGMTKNQYYDAVAFARDVNPALQVPPFNGLERGGIVGVAHLDGVLPATPMPTVPWHMTDQCGFLLSDVHPLPFLTCSGALGFWGDFDVRDGKAVRL